MRLVGARASVLAMGCDPAAGIHLRGHLRPVPAPDCVQATVARSALLTWSAAKPPDRVATHRGERDYVAVLADGGRHPGTGNLTVRTLGDSAVLTLRFQWIGRLRTVPHTTRRWVAERGTALVHELRAASGPRAPATVTCEQVDGFSKHPPPCGGPPPGNVSSLTARGCIGLCPRARRRTIGAARPRHRRPPLHVAGSR